MFTVITIPGVPGLTRLALMLCLVGGHAVAQGQCAFSAPEGWNQTRTRWEGDCRAGHAEGVGVLKEYDGKEVKRLFFGLAKNGDIELGVIDQAEGYVAGRFDKGRQVPSDDRQTFINAFAEAEKAAIQVASRYRKAGNKASARFYEDKARQLREQMD